MMIGQRDFLGTTIAAQRERIERSRRREPFAARESSTRATGSLVVWSKR